MDTSASLLQRLKTSSNEDDWDALVSVYTPLIRGWIRRYSASTRDADDVVQEALAVVVRRLPEFERLRTGSFRSWLRTITVNCLRDSWRLRKFRPSGTGGSDFQDVLDQLADPASQLSQLWNEEHDQHVLKGLLDQIRPLIPDETWQAFRRVTVAGDPPDKVAEDLGITVNKVYIAKSRVMARLRELGQGLLE